MRRAVRSWVDEVLRGGTERIVLCCCVTPTGSAGIEGCKSDEPLRLWMLGLRFDSSMGDEGCKSVEFFLCFGEVEEW